MQWINSIHTAFIQFIQFIQHSFNSFNSITSTAIARSGVPFFSTDYFALLRKSTADGKTHTGGMWHLEGRMGREDGKGNILTFLYFLLCIPASEPFPALLPPLTVWSPLIATSIITLWRLHSSTLQPSAVSFSCQSSPYSIVCVCVCVCVFSLQILPGCPQNARQIKTKPSRLYHIFCFDSVFKSSPWSLFRFHCPTGAAPTLTHLVKCPVSICTSLHSQDNLLFATEEIQARTPHLQP